MSHLVETMMYVGAEPWHGLGKKLDAPPTTAEAIVMAGLDWRVEAMPMFAQEMVSPGQRVPWDDQPVDLVPGREFETVPEAQVVRRMSDGETLGVVGSRWTPVQNKDAFNFFDPLVQDGMAVLHTAGSLNGGRTVWILAQIGETRNVVGDDNVGQFLLLSMGHDGKRAVQITPTPIRVVCANTLGMADYAAEGQKTMVKIAHTANAAKRLGEVGDFIKPHLANFEHTMSVFEILAQANVTGTAADAYLKALFPDPVGEDVSTAYAERVRKEIMAKFEGDLLGYDAIPAHLRSTYWVLYNSVTEYIDHDRGSDKHRLNSAWFGSGRTVKADALAYAKQPQLIA